MALPDAFQHLSLPLISAPMFLVSGPELVIEACKAGVIGTFPALNQRSSEGFEEWLQTIRSALDEFEASTGRKAAPFGVNLIVHQSNPRLQADLALCAKYRVPLIITSLGAVAELVDAVHGYGGVVFHDVINVRHAKKAASAGVDGLIAVCAGAGGHAGTLSPFALVGEIRQFFDKTVILSGCLSSGQDIATAQMLGADMAYMGTRFINTRESQATDDYKDMIVASAAGDIVYTQEISGVPANFLRPSLVAAGLDPDNLAPKKDIDFGKELQAPKDGAKAWKTIWSAGQGVANIHDVPTVAELVQRLQDEYQAAGERFSRLSQRYGVAAGEGIAEGAAL
ncbi:nitronate monooxygenase family protein [Pokkaliibacter sp. MBI-7]|uniref:NAD(P)H-dependent flavin oxidoreductase n=1 Tax=Pokkaliibacter sp. MBI-7 TaxID=3040600 RepID=UPI00244A201A|nr:nitronate monooxygenase family protein [Pokkaliibacter sp. MBI-7]MDH2433892.1 nitronate monooxygenase family protein [Pokkaliibacter sp. MBI-7]